MITKITNEIKQHFHGKNLKVLKSGSRKFGINYKILNSPRLQSDIDINFVFNFENVAKDNMVALFENYLDQIYQIVLKHQNESLETRKFPGLIRLKFNNKIYDLSFLWQKDKLYHSLDKNGAVRTSDVFDFEKRLKSFVKNNPYAKETLTYLKTLGAFFRIFEYRLPKAVFLSLLVMKFYTPKHNVENTIFYTIENIYNYLKENSRNKEFVYDNSYSITIKFDASAIEAFCSILKTILDQKQITNIYNK